MKIIFVTGWVLSWIGKWITWASIWAILEWGGYKVFMQKLDWYLNVDPGTMSPFQHWEVFVTDDWAETDLDLGHYERFIDENLSHLSSFTSGKFYEELIKRERNWDYLGKTVQIIPHLTNLVKEKIKEAYKASKAKIMIVEIGWTVWDMENEYFIEAARQMRHELGAQNVAFVHVTLLPYIAASKELKTKPTQHSVREIMSYWIYPDFLVLRADTHIKESVLEKTAQMCGIDKKYVIPAPTVKSIYEIPLNYTERNLWGLILEKFGLENNWFNLEKWEKLNNNIKKSKEELIIWMIWKYNDLEDAYYSLNEWLRTAWFNFNKKVHLEFIDATLIEENWVEILNKLDWICIPGWFWERWIEWMILACNFARENKVPYLWICLWSQIMAMEFARNVLNENDANSEEFDKECKCNIVHIMESQKSVYKKWWTMRLGSFPCKIEHWSLAQKVYWCDLVNERHRHRFEFNNNFREAMQNAGFIVSGKSPDWELAEIVEIKNHPFMIWSQFHPEFKSRPTNPHPLFIGFIKAII